VLGGLAAASSALVVDGPVYGYSSAPGPNGNITTVIFWLKTASGASSVDLNVNKTTIAFENPRGVWPNVYNSGGGDLNYMVGSVTYSVTNSIAANATTIVWEVGTGFQLQPGQKVRVTIDLTALNSASGTYPGWPTGGTTSTTYAPWGEVTKNEEFKVVIKPPIGSVLEVDRVAPASVDAVNDLG